LPPSAQEARDVVEIFVNEAANMPWGNRSLLIRDLEGNLVNIFTPTSNAAQSRFPEKSTTR